MSLPSLNAQVLTCEKIRDNIKDFLTSNYNLNNNGPFGCQQIIYLIIIIVKFIKFLLPKYQLNIFINKYSQAKDNVRISQLLNTLSPATFECVY